MEKLLPSYLRIEKVNAFRVTKPRLIGDIGLRAFLQLYKKAKQLIQSENIDFLYIPVPSFYCALLGRWLHHSTKIKYGIDYIDPWVHNFPGSDKIFSRHWLSTKIARFLEPIAVKRASLITGVAEGYYQGVAERNPHLLRQAIWGAMPYGGEKADHEKLKNVHNLPYLFKKNSHKIQLVYAGAMLPKAYTVLEAIFQSIKAHPASFENIEFHFIGTGRIVNDPESFTIKPIAQKFGLWETTVFEYAQRIPYLDVLAHLHAADGVFILGSTEPHYTPSKVYQAVLAEKPLLAVLHSASSAKSVIEESGAGMVLAFNGERDLINVSARFESTFNDYLIYLRNYQISKIDKAIFEQYSAYNVTARLSDLLNQAVDNVV